MRLERNKLIVDGAINGQKIGIMLDTGASRSLILHAAAVRLGLTLKELPRQRFFGVGGETNAEATRIDELRIGDTVRRDWTVIVLGERDLGPGYSFILGEDFFGKVDVEFDLAHVAVRLFVPKDCETAPLAYWVSNGASAVAIEKGNASRIVLPVAVNGRTLQAQLDSGSDRTVLTKLDAERLGVTPETPGVVATGSGGGLGRKAIPEWAGPFATVVIGDETIRDTTIHFADLWKDVTYTPRGSLAPARLEGLPSMLLGVDFLRSHRVLVSHSQRRMYFTYTGGPVFAAADPAGPAPSPEGSAARAGAQVHDDR